MRFAWAAYAGSGLHQGVGKDGFQRLLGEVVHRSCHQQEKRTGKQAVKSLQKEDLY